MTGLNSSPITSQNQVGLKWSLGAVTIFNTSTPAPNIFTINSNGRLLANNLVDLTSYSVPVNLTDCDGNGLNATTCNLVVSVGAQHVPRTICGNRRGNIKAATCGQNSEWLFAQTNNNTTQAGGLPYPTGAVYPPNSLYNVRVQSNAVTGDNCLTGALTQGRMELKINLEGGSTTPVGSDAIITYWIQFRSTSNPSWISATAIADGSLATITTGNTISAAAQGAVTQLIYNFSQPGEYRVVTDYLRGTACQTGANPAFT